MPDPADLTPANRDSAATQGSANAADIVPLHAGMEWAEICPLDMTASHPHHQELLRALPDTLAEMARVTSLATALKIAERFGGTRLYLARRPEAGSALAQLVGLPAARALGEHFGREQLEVPRAGAVLRASRNSRIRMLKRRGTSMKKLARDFGMTERQLRRITRKDGDDARAQPRGSHAKRATV